jgi:hypothetical protein
MSITAGLHYFTDFLQRGPDLGAFCGLCVRDVTGVLRGDPSGAISFYFSASQMQAMA